MPIHKRIISGFKRILPQITPALSLLPGGALVTSLAGTLLGGTRQVQQQIQQATAGIIGPILPPSRFAPQPQLAVDPAVAAADTQRDIDRIVAEIRAGSRSRSNVPPRLKSAVEAALGSFVFGQPQGGAIVAPVPRAGDTAITRWQAEVLAGTRSFDNFPPGVTSAMKRELAARVLKKLGPGFLPQSFRGAPSVTTPVEVAAGRPTLFGGPTMPVRQLAPIAAQPIGFDGFGATPGGVPIAPAAVGVAGALALRAVPALGQLARSFGRIMSTTGVGRGIRSVVGWVRGNPGTAAAVAASLALSIPEFTERLVEESVIAFQKQDCVLRRADMKGFDRTVKVAKKLGVFTRRAPARSGARRRVRKHRHRVTNV